MKRNIATGFFIVLSLCFLSVMLLLPCRQLFAQKPASVVTPQKPLPAFSYKIIAGSKGTFGYDIYQGSRLKIHQPSIPAVMGNAGFTTSAAAEKVALLVISKMEKGKTFPSVSIAEMKKLQVLQELSKQ